jgi:GT2 family glycosyltransferase
LSVFSRALLEKVGKFRSEFDGSQDYDMILRLTEKAEKIVHIPKILYYWRAHASSVASDISAKPYTLDAARRALAEHLERVGLEGRVVDSRIPSTYKIEYKIKGEPKVSIIIPNKDHTADLDKCIRSIEDISTYKNYEIIVVENNSDEPETFGYYERITEEYSNVKVVVWDSDFNYSKINNFGVKYADGDYYLLLNNDIEILTPSWIEEMLMFTQREDVGAAGMMLYYPDDTVQHAGVILGIGGVAGHAHKYFNRGDYGYASRLSIAQNFSAVTAAALMVRRDVWDKVGGLDEDFAVAFNDVDFCMKIRDAGYLIVWTPYAEGYHYESKSRGLEDTIEKQKRFKGECDKFFAKWQDELDAGDPYYNPNLTLEREDFGVR